MELSLFFTSTIFYFLLFFTALLTLQGNSIEIDLKEKKREKQHIGCKEDKLIHR